MANRVSKEKCDFLNTPLGSMIYKSAPLEYSLIISASPKSGPTGDFVEAISYNSSNPIFRTRDFRIALIYYRKYGLYPENKNTVNFTEKEKIAYSNIQDMLFKKNKTGL